MSYPRQFHLNTIFPSAEESTGFVDELEALIVKHRKNAVIVLDIRDGFPDPLNDIRRALGSLEVRK